jgi:hypothetical protein
MRNIILAASLLLSLAVPPSAGEGESRTIEWVHQFSAIGGSTDLAQAVAFDGSGNVYIVGQVLGALTGQTTAGGGDVYVRKYDAFGNLIWSSRLGTSRNDNAFAVGGVQLAVDRTGEALHGLGAVATTAAGACGPFVSGAETIDVSGIRLTLNQDPLGPPISLVKSFVPHASMLDKLQ